MSKKVHQVLYETIIAKISNLLTIVDDNSDKTALQTLLFNFILHKTQYDRQPNPIKMNLLSIFEHPVCQYSPFSSLMQFSGIKLQ